jgi:hypothetical protein
MAVSPVTSTTWAAAFQTPLDVWNVEIFDNGVARPDMWSVASDNIEGNEALWSSDASTMYILDVNLNAVAVSASGLGSGTQLQSGSAASGGFDYGGGLQLAGGLLYSDSGGVLNPTTDTIVGQYVFPTGVPYASLTLDTVNNRTFASYNQTVTTTNIPTTVEGTIESYDLTQFTPIWIARLPIGTPLRWGANGLAGLGPSPTVTGASALYLISGTFVAP